MNEKINPVGLKGYQVTERMKELMGIKPINENKKTSVVELTKKGPDGNVYGIVRENHEYYIKITKKQNNLVVEDFQYMGGLQNKKQEVYPSYAKALKHLNLKFHSLNEAYGKSGQVNVFLDDKLLTEDYAAFESMSGSGFKAEGNMEGHMTSECCGAQTMEGMCLECGGSAYGMGGGMEEYDKPAMGSMKKQYGDEKGEKVYYATANKQDRDPETFEKNEGMSDDWVDVHGVDEDLMPEMAAVHGMMEKDLSPAQEKIAKLAGDPDEIGADDLAALRAGKMNKKNEGKLSIERAMGMMDEMIDELQESRSKKKI